MDKSNSLKKSFSPYFKTVEIEDGSRKIDLKDKSTVMNLVVILLGIIFGIIMIIMGSLHADRSFSDSLKSGVIHTSCSLVDRCGCPGQPIIPWYLVIGGILTILFLVGRILLCRACTQGPGQLESRTCDVSYQAIYDVIALVITVTWTAVGTHFIADLFLRKNYNTKKPNQDTCDFDLYWFSFAVILLGWVAVCLAVAYIINKYGRELLNCMTCNKYGY